MKTLSDKRQDTNTDTPRFRRFAYAEEDVKEFIKELKDKIKMGMMDVDGENHLADHWDIHDLIDKLAGPKLI